MLQHAASVRRGGSGAAAVAADALAVQQHAQRRAMHMRAVSTALLPSRIASSAVLSSPAAAPVAATAVVCHSARSFSSSTSSRGKNAARPAASSTPSTSRWTLPALHASLSVYESSGNVTAADAVWERLQRNLTPTAESYRRMQMVLLTAATNDGASAGQKQRATEAAARSEALWSSMSAAGVAFAPADFDAILQLAARRQKLDLASLWLSRVTWDQLNETTRSMLEALSEREERGASAAAGGSKSAKLRTPPKPQEAEPSSEAEQPTMPNDIVQLAEQAEKANEERARALFTQAEKSWGRLLRERPQLSVFDTHALSPSHTRAMLRMCIAARQSKRLVDVLLDALRLERDLQPAAPNSSAGSDPNAQPVTLVPVDAFLTVMQRAHEASDVSKERRLDEVYSFLCERPVAEASAAMATAAEAATLFVEFKLRRPRQLLNVMHAMPPRFKERNARIFAVAWRAIGALVAERSQNPAASPAEAAAAAEALVLDAQLLALDASSSDVPLGPDEYRLWLGTFIGAPAKFFSAGEGAWEQAQSSLQKQGRIVPPQLLGQALLFYLSMGRARPDALSKAEALYASTQEAAATAPSRLTIAEVSAAAQMAGSLGLPDVEQRWIQRAAQMGHSLAVTPPDNARIAMAEASAASQAPQLSAQPSALASAPTTSTPLPAMRLATSYPEGSALRDLLETAPSTIVHPVVRGGGSASAVAAAASATERSKLDAVAANYAAQSGSTVARAAPGGHVGELASSASGALSPKQALRLRRSQEYRANVSRRKLQNLMGIAPEQPSQQEQATSDKVAAATTQPAAAPAADGAASAAPAMATVTTDGVSFVPQRASYLNPDPTVALADFSNPVARVSKLAQESDALFPANKQSSPLVRQKLLGKSEYKKRRLEAAQLLDRMVDLARKRAESDNPIFPPTTEWMAALHAARKMQLPSLATQVYLVYLRTEQRRAQAVEASSEKPAEFADLPGGVDSRTARKQELTKARQLPVNITSTDALNAVQGLSTQQNQQDATAVGDQAQPSVIATALAASGFVPVRPADPVAAAAAAAEDAARAERLKAAQDAAEAAVPSTFEDGSPLSEPVLRHQRLKARQLVEYQEREQRDPNPLPDARSLLQEVRDRKPPVAFQTMMLDSIVEANPGPKGAAEAARWLNYMLRAGYGVNVRALAVVLRAFALLMPHRERNDPTPLPVSDLALVRSLHDALLKVPLVPAPAAGENGHVALSLIMLQSYMNQRDFDSMAAMETVLRAQLTAQAAQGTAVPAVPAILMESLCQRRAEIALQHSDALHLAEIGGRTDAFVASQLSTSVASASSIQSDADALWQIVLNDPVKLLRAGVAYAYLHLQYLNNDVVRMCAVMDQVMRIENQLLETQAIKARAKEEASKTEADAAEEKDAEGDANAVVETGKDGKPVAAAGTAAAEDEGPTSVPVMFDSRCGHLMLLAFSDQPKPHLYISTVERLQAKMLQRYEAALASSDPRRISLLQPDDRLVNAHARYMQRSGQTRLLQSVLSELPALHKENNPVLYLTAFNNAVSGSAHADVVAKDMEAHGIEWDAHLVNSHLQGTSDKGEWQRAEQIWLQMLQRRIQPDAVLYRTLMNTFMAAAGNAKAARRPEEMEVHLRKIAMLREEMSVGTYTQGKSLHFDARDLAALLRSARFHRLPTMATLFRQIAEVEGRWEELPTEMRVIAMSPGLWRNKPRSALTPMAWREARIAADLREANLLSAGEAAAIAAAKREADVRATERAAEAAEQRERETARQFRMGWQRLAMREIDLRGGAAKVNAAARAQIESAAQAKVRQMMELKERTLRAQKQRMAHVQAVAKQGPLLDRVHVSHAFFKGTSKAPVVSAALMRKSPALAKALARQARRAAQRKRTVLPLLYNKTAAGLSVEQGDLASAAAMRKRVRDLVASGMAWTAASKAARRKKLGPKTKARLAVLEAERRRQAEIAQKPLLTRASVAVSDLASSVKTSVVSSVTSTPLFARLQATMKQLLPHEVKEGTAGLRAQKYAEHPLAPTAKAKKLTAAEAAARDFASAQVVRPPTAEEIELARQERARLQAEAEARQVREAALERERARLLEIARKRAEQKAQAALKAKAAENARKAKAAAAKQAQQTDA